MATIAAPAPEVAEAPAKKGGPKLILIGAVAGLGLGWVVGSMVIAPRLAQAPADAAAEVVEGEHGATEEKGPSTVHQIENLVVNPANTNGSRFLLITTAIVVRDAAALEEVAARDAEVRDRVVELLSSRTVEQLSDPASRESLKQDLAAAVGALFEEGVVKRVLLPQFVIQ